MSIIISKEKNGAKKHWWHSHTHTHTHTLILSLTHTHEWGRHRSQKNCVQKTDYFFYSTKTCFQTQTQLKLNSFLFQLTKKFKFDGILSCFIAYIFQTINKQIPVVHLFLQAHRQDLPVVWPKGPSKQICLSNLLYFSMIFVIPSESES